MEKLHGLLPSEAEAVVRIVNRRSFFSQSELPTAPLRSTEGLSAPACPTGSMLIIF